MNRYEFKVTYISDISGRSNTYEIEATQISDAYYVLLNCTLNEDE